MKILCFGDSNTWGFDPRSFFGERYDAADRWPERLAELTGYEIINEGANGRIIPRNPYVLRTLQKHAPVDLFLVMLGTNDLLQGADAETAAQRMELFLKDLLPHCPNVLLIAPPPMKRGAWVPTDGLVDGSYRLADAYREVADRLDIPYVDTREWKIELCFDGVHFTEDGHRAFAKNLKKVLDSHLA